jgi:hypothetical protein
VAEIWHGCRTRVTLLGIFSVELAGGACYQPAELAELAGWTAPALIT